MPSVPKIIMRIIAVTGKCGAQHKVGQEFDLSGDIILGQEGHLNSICPSAFYALYPNYRALKSGGVLPWEKEDDVAHVACPDPFNPVIMQLKRIKG